MFDARKFERVLKIGAACLILFQLGAPPIASAQTGPGAGANTPTAVVGGYVQSLSGPVFIRRGTEREAPAKVGDVFGARTSIRSAAGTEVVLLFADGQNVKLGPSSTLRIDDYRFDPTNPQNGRAAFVLVTGMMRVVTGAMHTDNQTGLKITAGRSVVTILSKDLTAFVMQVNGEDDERGISAVIAGQIAIRTPYGVIRRVAGDQFARWEPGVVPNLAQPLAAAPAAVQALVEASRASVQETNSPVDVQSASIQAALSVAQATAKGAGGILSVGPLSGQLNMVVGIVIIRDASGREVQARIGDRFGPGAIVTTAPDGQAGLVFSEGQYAVLGAESVFRIAESKPERRGGEAVGASFGLLNGRMSFVTWATSIGDQDALRIAAGDGSIVLLSNGVAAFVVEVDSKTKQVGSLAVTAGEISLQTSTGGPMKIVADQYTSWGPGGAPAPLLPLSEAPGPLQSAFADKVVASAARSAELVAELAALPPTGAGPGLIGLRWP